MQITFNNTTELTQRQEYIIQCFLEITGKLEKVLVINHKDEDDLKAVKAIDLDTDEEVCYFDVTDLEDVIPYQL